MDNIDPIVGSVTLNIYKSQRTTVEFKGEVTLTPLIGGLQKMRNAYLLGYQRLKREAELADKVVKDAKEAEAKKIVGTEHENRPAGKPESESGTGTPKAAEQPGASESSSGASGIQTRTPGKTPGEKANS